MNQNEYRVHNMCSILIRVLDTHYLFMYSILVTYVLDIHYI